MQLASLRHDFLGLPDRPSGDGGVHDLIQGDDCDPPPQLAALEQGLARLLVVGHHEEEPAARADLQGPVERGVVGIDVEELGHDALDLAAVEAPVGVREVEVQVAEVGAERVHALLRLVERGLALPRRLDQLLVALRVELQFLQLLPLLVDEVFCDGLFLRQPLTLLLALRQGLLRTADPLLQARDAHGLLLLLGLHLGEPRLRGQKLLAEGPALALSFGRRLCGHAGGQGLHRPLCLLDILLHLVLLLGQGVELALLLLIDLLLLLHLLCQLPQCRLRLFSALEQRLQV
mmetsp:Transcript_84461/g.247708  ORF Transcript_84461/g.247708 Transcript_84461/m.247708 type:complete len:290 (-) Transcript_84461:1051-1920(-)